MIAIGADHGGFELKEKIIEFFQGKIEFKDCGTNSKESVDYPKFAYLVADSVASGECEAGIVICRTGVGVSITANKVKGIRCALCYNKEVAQLCKEHNNANIIALGGRVTGTELAADIVDSWMNAEFQGGRHQGRIDIISSFEK